MQQAMLHALALAPEVQDRLAAAILREEPLPVIEA